MAELPTGTVTFLFTDLVTSSRLWEERPTAMNAALVRHDELLRSAVGAHGGRVVKHTGDGMLAVFATAIDAIGAALDGQRALMVEDWGVVGSLRARMGLHTGVAEHRDGDYFGTVLNRAARVMAMAHAGQVLCSQATADLARDSLTEGIGLIELGAYQLRDLQRPEVVFQLTHPELPADFPRLSAARSIAGNLPRQVTSFVGHEQDLPNIAVELEQISVVTLTGVGGVGKTRLALEAAARVANEYRDGAWVCKLEGVRQGDAVADAVLEVFGVDPGQGGSSEGALIRFLRSKQLLLVLDNCEHLLRPVARLTREIVSACGEVRILATSREGIGVPGERIVAVASLDVPEATESIERVRECQAVRLFIARAQAVRADFDVDASNAGAVAQICSRLDGVPLAIELAAARVALLTPSELARRLDQRFRVLTGSEHSAVERHQTLRAAIDWSYDLLDDLERGLLERLSVFAGGFAFGAAEAVGATVGIDTDVFELLAGLVAKSLVVADTHGAEARYRLLETIRQYAEERLDERGDAPSARDAHARYFATFAEAAAEGLRSVDEPNWIERIAQESDNIRAALTWATESQDVDRILCFFTPARTLDISEITRIANAGASAALAVPGLAEDRRFPIVLACAAMHAARDGNLERMHRYVTGALAIQERGGEWFLEVYFANSWAALTDGRLGDYQKIQEEALVILRELQLRESLAFSLSSSAMGKTLKGEDMTAAVAEIDEALSLADGITIPSFRMSLTATAAFVLADMQPDRAKTSLDDAIRMWKLLPGNIYPVHSILGDVAERLGDRRLALEYFVLGMHEHDWLGQTELTGRMQRRIGLALAETDPEAAAIITGAGIARSQSSTLTERVNTQHRQRIAVLENILGADRCNKLIQQGATLTDSQAVTLAHETVAKALASLTTDNQSLGGKERA
jgi:predicted ATPase/class 3 adenylate cyclase